MGRYLADIYVGGLLDQLNLRFGPNEAITEMLALQKEFDIFSDKHSLEHSFGLLNVAPVGSWANRRGWYRYLDSLRQRPSDRAGQNGHDRLISALKEHLEAGQPIPIHFSCHGSQKDERVRFVRRLKQTLVYSTQEFVTISLPVTAIERDRRKRRAGRT